MMNWPLGVKRNTRPLRVEWIRWPEGSPESWRPDLGLMLDEAPCVAMAPGVQGLRAKPPGRLQTGSGKLTRRSRRISWKPQACFEADLRHLLA